MHELTRTVMILTPGNSEEKKITPANESGKCLPAIILSSNNEGEKPPLRGKISRVSSTEDVVDEPQKKLEMSFISACNQLKQVSQLFQELVGFESQKNLNPNDIQLYLGANQKWITMQNIFLYNYYSSTIQNVDTIDKEIYKKEILHQVRSLLDKECHINSSLPVCGDKNEKIIKHFVAQDIQNIFKKISPFLKSTRESNKKVKADQETEEKISGDTRTRAHSTEVPTPQVLPEEKKLLRTSSHSKMNGNKEDPSSLSKKLLNTVDYYIGANQILDAYYQFLDQVSRQKIKLDSQGFQGYIVDRIVEIIKTSKNDIDFSEHEAELFFQDLFQGIYLLFQEELMNIQRLIKHTKAALRETSARLEKFREASLENKKKLADLIQSRKYEINTLHDLQTRLANHLFNSKMACPEDILRTLDGSTLNIYDEKNHKVDLSDLKSGERYQKMLTLFSMHFFKNDKIFTGLYKTLTKLCDKDFAFSNSNIVTIYSKLMTLTDKEKQSLRVEFENEFGPAIKFEKVLKYFIFSHNFLSQTANYVVTNGVFEAKRFKFNRSKVGFVRPNIKEEDKIQTIVSLTGNGCKITCVKRNGILDPDCIFTQEYSYLIDPMNDTSQIFSDVKLELECSRKKMQQNEDFLPTLVELKLTLDSMNLELEIKDTEIT